MYSTTTNTGIDVHINNRPCKWCGELTENRDELHTHCRPISLEHDQWRWDYKVLVAKLDWPRLSERNRLFIEWSVQRRMMNGAKLSQYQQSWLDNLLVLYPADLSPRVTIEDHQWK